jgi:hypothetical protein
MASDGLGQAPSPMASRAANVPMLIVISTEVADQAHSISDRSGST